MGLYLVGLLGDSYYGFFVNNSVFKGFFDFVFTLSFYTRNGLFYAPMFLSIGYFVKKKKNVDVKKSAILGLVFTGAMMVEITTKVPRWTPGNTKDDNIDHLRIVLSKTAKVKNFRKKRRRKKRRVISR